MNSWLAQVYGTGGAQEQDFEKTAQSMLLQKLAAEEGLSLEGLTPEQIDALAADVLSDQQGEGQQVEGQEGQEEGMIAQAGEGASEEDVDEEAGGEEDLTKEAAQKFEEADFLGRVMAHAYTQELEKIAGRFGDAGNAVKSFGRKAATSIGGVGRRAGSAISSGAKTVGDKAKSGYGAAKTHVGNHPKKYVGGAAAAGGGAAGYAAGRSKEKNASPILEKLAQIRAAEILEESGIDPATGQPLQAAQAQGGQVAEPAAPEQVQQAVDQRAVEILKEAGYTFR
jgi:hypothetical protein